MNLNSTQILNSLVTSSFGLTNKITRSNIANLYFTATLISLVLQLIYHNLPELSEHLLFSRICPDNIHCASAKTDL